MSFIRYEKQIQFRNQILLMNEHDMLQWGQILADLSPLKLYYIKTTFRSLLAEHLKSHWDVNQPEINLAAHTLRHSKVQINSFLREACLKHRLDPKILARFLPSSFILTVQPFLVTFEWEVGPREEKWLEKVVVYQWDHQQTVEHNLIPFDAQPLGADLHCSFCHTSWDVALGRTQHIPPQFQLFASYLPLFEPL